jgi:hypothetical protein
MNPKIIVMSLEKLFLEVLAGKSTEDLYKVYKEEDLEFPKRFPFLQTYFEFVKGMIVFFFNVIFLEHIRIEKRKRGNNSVRSEKEVNLFKKLIEKPSNIDEGAWAFESLRDCLVDLVRLVTLMSLECTCANSGACNYSIHTIEMFFQQFSDNNKCKNRWEVVFDKSMVINRLLSVYSHARDYHRKIFVQFEE